MIGVSVMERAKILLIAGLILFIAGIYISTHLEIPGVLMGIFGGMMMGSSTYFFINGMQNKH